jgi:hypothetical protein
VADFAVRYNDFSAGHAGNSDLAKLPPHSFRGQDVELYTTQLVGPRAGLKVLPVTGLPNAIAAFGPVGFDVYGNNLAVCATNTYLVPTTGGAAVLASTYPTGAIKAPVQYAQGNSTLYSLNDGVVYKHAVGGGAASAISTPAPFSRFIRWNYNLVAVDRGLPYRLWFTNVDASGSNFDSWPANNYLDVGTDPITSLNPIHNALYIGKGSGWWVVSGVLGTQAYVRSVQIGGGPLDQRQCTVTLDGRMLYYPADPAPTWFNGVWSRIVSQFRIDGPVAVPLSPTDTVVASPTAERIYLAADLGDGTTQMVSGIGHWSRYTWVGHWSFQRFPMRIGGLVPSDIRYGYQMPSQVMYATKRVTTIGDPIVIYSWQHELDRPAIASDTYAAPADDGQPLPVTGTLILPAWYDGQGRQVTVRSLIINFAKWNLGVPYAMNQITVRVDALGRYGGGAEQGNTQQWIEPTGRASSSGTDDSWRVNIGEQGAGNGFLVTLTLTGVAIREVVALCNLRGDRT